MARPPGQQQATGFAKRVLVVDPDQKTWEPCAQLLIAQGYVVHRISRIADAPPRWPQYLYDLVVVATADPANPEVVQFCQKLAQVQPPVTVALLGSGSPSHNPQAYRCSPASSLPPTLRRTSRDSCGKRVLNVP